eukprot:CAMPEP_0197455432 /NCGR_PEP_ID=MMETSP1175-20131217/40783_1 /TAXON_ID=1003142 /ORGANISM="Triceratium dubium, Strain CCMP147" /LENGTH=125 /DNA_ID=CAMNT_0042989293 /DNA_START=69 /DNA_END=444 /DNA_ORIENTATION=-
MASLPVKRSLPDDPTLDTPPPSTRIRPTSRPSFSVSTDNKSNLPDGVVDSHSPFDSVEHTRRISAPATTLDNVSIETLPAVAEGGALLGGTVAGAAAAVALNSEEDAGTEGGESITGTKRPFCDW